MLRCGPSDRTFAARAKFDDGRTHSVRTKRPDAHAAIADAAFPRSGGRFYAALRLASWKRPFKATISADSRPTFRRVMFELTQRGLSGLVHVRLLLTQHFVAAAAYFMLQLQPKSWKRPFNDTDVSGFQTDPSPRLVRTNRGRTKRTRARVRFRAKSSRALQLQPLGH